MQCFSLQWSNLIFWKIRRGKWDSVFNGLKQVTNETMTSWSFSPHKGYYRKQRLQERTWIQKWNGLEVEFFVGGGMDGRKAFKTKQHIHCGKI